MPVQLVKSPVRLGNGCHGGQQLAADLGQRDLAFGGEPPCLLPEPGPLAELGQRLGHQFYQPAERTLIPGMLGRADELTSANALMAASNAVTRLAGASLGGVVFAAAGLSALVTIDAASYVAVAACLALLRWRAAARLWPGWPTRPWAAS
jgi:Transmembrane secretion effector